MYRISTVPKCREPRGAEHLCLPVDQQRPSGHSGTSVKSRLSLLTMLAVWVLLSTSCARSSSDVGHTVIPNDVKTTNALGSVRRQPGRMLILFALSPTCSACIKTSRQFRAFIADACTRHDCRALTVGTTTIGVRKYFEEHSIQPLEILASTPALQDALSLTATPMIVIVPGGVASIHTYIGAPAVHLTHLTGLIGLSKKTELEIWMRGTVL